MSSTDSFKAPRRRERLASLAVRLERHCPRDEAVTVHVEVEERTFNRNIARELSTLAGSIECQRGGGWYRKVPSLDKKQSCTFRDSNLDGMSERDGSPGVGGAKRDGTAHERLTIDVPPAAAAPRVIYSLPKDTRDISASGLSG